MIEFKIPDGWDRPKEREGYQWWDIQWSDLVTPPLREIWHTLSDDQKKAVAHSLQEAAEAQASAGESAAGDDV